jgi:hypothetical protein
MNAVPKMTKLSEHYFLDILGDSLKGFLSVWAPSKMSKSNFPRCSPFPQDAPVFIEVAQENRTGHLGKNARHGCRPVSNFPGPRQALLAGRPMPTEAGRI